MTQLIIDAFVGGLTIAFLTGLVMGYKRAIKFPGGSFIFGYSIVSSIIPNPTNTHYIIGILCGTLGWIVYIILFKPR